MSNLIDRGSVVTRRIILIVSVLIVFISFSIMSEAKTLSLSIDGNPVLFDNTTGYPFIDEQNRTMMPLRACLNSIGCNVQWDQYSQMVYATKGLTEVVVPIGKNEIIVNQKTVPIDTAAVLKNGRTYLPLRAVFNAFRYNVDWNDDTKAIKAASMFKPSTINGGTTGVFLRKQLNYAGFDGIQADIRLPKVYLGQKGDCPYVYFGFDFPDGKGDAEGGFQFIEDQNHPGYNKWTVYLRQGDEWRWGDNILLDQESHHNLRFYIDRVSDSQTDLVIALDGKEVIRKASFVNDFSKASVKYVDAIAMSVPFDGTNCRSASIDFQFSNLTVSELNKEEYKDMTQYDSYSEYKNGYWYGTVENIPEYMHYGGAEIVSLYRTSKTGNHITLPAEIVSGEVSNTFSAGGSIQHELSPAELKAFVDFFHSCDIREGEKEFPTVNDHDHLSDSIDLKLRLKNGKEYYILAFYDGDIQILDWDDNYYYYIHNAVLQDYIINTMGKYLIP